MLWPNRILIQFEAMIVSHKSPKESQSFMDDIFFEIF